jgi:hypothetical protein
MLPVDWSVNWTVKGAWPEVGEAEKLATGGGGVVTVIVALALSLPPLPVTVSVTVNVPALL